MLYGVCYSFISGTLLSVSVYRKKKEHLEGGLELFTLTETPKHYFKHKGLEDILRKIQVLALALLLPSTNDWV